MSKLQVPESPAMVFFITDNRRTSFDTEIKCPECQYIYPTEKIKKHMCHILDHIICKGCEQYYPNKLMKELWPIIKPMAKIPVEYPTLDILEEIGCNDRESDLEDAKALKNLKRLN